LSAALDAEASAAVTALVRAATDADGARPFSEQTMLRLTGEHPGVRHLLLHLGDPADPDALAGYAQLDGSGGAELAVHPKHRGQGHGTAILHELLSAIPGLRVWSHTGHPAAAALARGAGLVPVRELWQMRRPLPLGPEADPPGPVPLPADVRVRTFVPGEDDGAWLALNARAFAGHPEQGRLTRVDLRDRLAQPWFDPAGFFLAERDEATGPRLLGFHWTKVHAGPRPVGEIYVLGVDPDAAGGGLGRALALVGLRHLSAAGLPEAMLYVDAANAAAVRVYERLGFAPAATDVMYGAPPAA
jgi:mycothiol synthase